MAFERPTFHEAWYRVAELHPRMRSTVQITRQHYRGQSWHVVQDHTNNAFFRLSEPAYRLIGLLDGKRPVGEAWKICQEQLGDDAPTQGETIQLLGQLYTSNLLQAETSPDTHGLFTRYRKRVNREIQGYLMNLMFIRIPILDPDRFLERWMPVFGWIFSWVGLAVWAVLLAVGFWQLTTVPNWAVKLMSGGGDIFNPNNLIGLYCGFAVIKGIHEFGHAIACRKFGMQSGVGGEVHVMGIMFLIFSPVPYVDASSSWALRSKWQRAMVGAAGMWVELAVAAVAAIVWARTSEGHVIHQLAYNIMFVASVSTVLFNANPLLRYDGYYILSDLLEIPNLAQRSKEYIYYVVKRYVWNVTQARNPAHSGVEQFWLFHYAWSSFLMRLVVSFGIMFYLASVLDGALILIATAMGIAAVAAWVVVPMGKFVHYLATSPELMRVRTRAVVTTLAAVALLAGGLGLIPAPHHVRAQGVVEPIAIQDLNVMQDGFIETLSSQVNGGRHGMPVVAEGTAVMTAENRALADEIRSLEAESRHLQTKYQMAMAQDPAVAQAWKRRLDTQQNLIASKKERLAALTLKTPIAGVLVTPKLEQARGMYAKQGEKLGVVADMAGLDRLIIRVATPNDIAGSLSREATDEVEVRVKGRPEILLKGVMTRRPQAGQNRLFSPSLGYAAGGDMQVTQDDKNGTKTTEEYFEVQVSRLEFINSAGGDVSQLLPGQRVLVRFNLESKPLATQAWTALLQMIQRRLHT